jgi:outer membrane lipoprotein carrier protein
MFVLNWFKVIGNSVYIIVTGLVLLSNFFVISAARAEPREFLCEPNSDNRLSSSELQEALNKTQERYEGIAALRASFEQDSFLKALEISEQSGGTVVFAKPGKMRWEYSKPEPQTFLIADSTFWLYQPREKQLLIDKMEQMLLSELPVAFLMGIGSLKEQFIADSGCRNFDGIVLKLLPKIKGVTNGSKDEQLRMFTLLIGSSTYLPVGAKTLDVGGNETAILLRDLVIEPKLPSDFFEASFPSDIDVQDRRAKK